MPRSFVEWKRLEEDLELGQERLSERSLAMLVRTLFIPIASANSKASIRQQRHPGGGRWRRLKESTQRVRASLGHLGIGPARPINKRTGALEQFLENAGAEVLVLPEYAEGAWPALVHQDSTRLMYAFHTAQAGSKRWGTPPRPVVALSPATMAVLDGMTRLYIEQLFESVNGALMAGEKGVF